MVTAVLAGLFVNVSPGGQGCCVAHIRIPGDVDLGIV